MAKKISQLTQATEVKSDDVTVIVQDGETKKLPLNMMVTKQDIENKKIAGLAKLDEIEATYENDTYTPTITVKNKSSVKTGEGDEVDYSANVMDGHAKSAILSGQTLVDLATENSIQFTTVGDWKHLKTKQKMLNTTKNYMVKFNSSHDYKGYVHLRDRETNTYITDSHRNNFKKGSNVVLLGSFLESDLESFSNIVITFFSDSDSATNLTITDVMLLEYQEGMENWDIPYFEGMQSVKMPVLKTTGKNLIDKQTLQRGYIDENGVFIKNDNDMATDYIKIHPNTKYTYKVFTNINYGMRFSFFNKSKSMIYRTGVINVSNGGYTTYESPSNAYYVRVHSNNFDNIGFDTDVSLVMGDAPLTLYEPYKSNILTVNEPIELRGIGDVQDTLNCLTGEVTQRIGEIVLDGSDDESWAIYTNNREKTVQFRVDVTSSKGQSDYTKIISDYLPNVNIISDNDIEGISIYSNGNIYISLLRTKAETLSGLKSYLQSNPITVQYELATESIKTVDLMPSGTHPSTTPYCWKNGHIQLSSSGLLPNLEYSVVTSRAGQINQNATMVVKNDKRIFDLEILLAGGLVNTTYQALTLQNQVETGLSKVSSSSETEPDYLLYHMIMKLIEEKAYKLDDLTEKVSVFYLYEKLSDEQFETIYSALYPFVEDEIVEEPVVEELPEVVEDEVIM